VLSEIPAVAKLVVALDQLDSVTAPEGEFVGGSGGKVICGSQRGARAERTATSTYG
jgi:hypothetical protein